MKKKINEVRMVPAMNTGFMQALEKGTSGGCCLVGEGSSWRAGELLSQLSLLGTWSVIPGGDDEGVEEVEAGGAQSRFRREAG